MSWLRCAHLKAGMVLGRDLSDNHGRLLFSAGARLVEADIDRLYALDLRGADVVEGGPDAAWPGRPPSHRFLDATDPYALRLLKLSGYGDEAGTGKE